VINSANPRNNRHPGEDKKLEQGFTNMTTEELLTLGEDKEFQSRVDFRHMKQSEKKKKEMGRRFGIWEMHESKKRRGGIDCPRNIAK
jgi:hypothetical protein